MKLRPMGCKMFDLFMFAQVDDLKSYLQLPRRQNSFLFFLLLFLHTLILVNFFLLETYFTPPSRYPLLLQIWAVFVVTFTMKYSGFVSYLFPLSVERKSRIIRSGLLEEFQASEKNEYVLKSFHKSKRQPTRDKGSPVGPRNSRTFDYSGIRSYHILRAHHVVDTLYEQCLSLQIHMQVTTPLSQMGKPRLGKVRQLL